MKKYLVEHGVTATRHETKGYGAAHILASGAIEEAHEKNRRVEFFIRR